MNKIRIYQLAIKYWIQGDQWDNAVEFAGSILDGQQIKRPECTEKRLKQDQVSEDKIITVEEAFNHQDHHARAAAFRAALNQMAIEYRGVETEGVASEYIYIEDPKDDQKESE